jgi:transcription termination/antitermination protein NusA
MNKDLLAIFEYLEKEKGIKRDIIIGAIEDSLRLAARKSDQGLSFAEVHLDPKTGEIDVLVQKTIVEKVDDEDEEISLEEALKLEPACEIGQRLEISVTPSDFGRIAAQTARQVITQKLRGAERDVIYEEYRHRINEIISGTVKQFIRGKNILVDLGKVDAIMPERNYPKTERYHIGERVQALLYEVRDTENGGAEVVLTRSHPGFVIAIFKQEVPELHDGVVEVKKAVREAGYRTKIAVSSRDDKVDPVGTCVGVRGTRIKNVIREINNEKIDIMPYSDDTIQLLQNALAPIEIKRIKATDDKITIVVNDDDYPMVIGKRGFNAKLLSQLIEMEIDVQKMTEHQKLIAVQLAELGESEDKSLDEPLKIEGLSNLLLESLIGNGYDTLRKILQADPIDLVASAPGINYLDMADKILEQSRQKKV